MNWWILAQADALNAAPRSAEGEGFATSLDHSWPWPAWITLLFLLVVAVLVAAIYLREQGHASRRWRMALASLRIGLIMLVLFMLYGWTRQLHRLDLPDLVIAIDHSASMSVLDPEPDETTRSFEQRLLKSARLDQASRFNVARSLLLPAEKGWLDRARSDYRVKIYALGDSAAMITGGAEEVKASIRQLQPDASASRLGLGLREILESQRGRPTAAVLMLTDGVTTEGQTIGNAAETARRMGIPLYLLGLGSDRPPRDLRLSDLLVDDTVFLEEMVNFDAQLHGNGLAGRNVTVRLKRRDRPEILAEQTLAVPPDGSSASVRLSHRPMEEGDFEYVVEASPVEGELNVENNRLTQRVQVRNATLRVLLASAYPSYEYRYLKDLLSRAVRIGKDGTSRAIELTTVLQEADLEQSKQDPASQAVFPVRSEDLFTQDVVIFGDVNPAFLSRSVMENLAEFVTERGGGVVFLSGPLFMPLSYRDTPLARLLPVNLATASVPPANEQLIDSFAVRPTPLGLSSPNLQLGDTAAETSRVWQQLPGLHWFVSTPDVRPAAHVLAVHPKKTGAQGELLPLVLLQFNGAGKVILHNTDETYRWSRYPGDPQYYARYWMQTLRYLSRSKLRAPNQVAEITTDRQQYRCGDPVRVRVRFLDDRRSPQSDDGVVVIVQQGGGRQQQLTLQRDPIRRELFEGTLTGLLDGQYRVWLAAADQSSARQFTVAAPPGEQARIAMDSADLLKAAETSQGQFATIRDASRLFSQLPPGRRVTIESLPPQPLWNSSLVAAAFVVLVSLEWLLRKRKGML
jgi:hypothetical protein